MMYKQLILVFFALLLGPVSVFASENNIKTLDEITMLALENSMEIQVLNYEIEMSKNISLRTKSIFDTYLNGALEYSNSKKVLYPDDSGSFSKANSYSLGLSKRFASGTELAVAASHDKLDDYLYDKREQADLQLTLKQSLGKNFFGLADRANVDIAEISSELVKSLSEEKIEQQIARVQRTYWFLSLQNAYVAINKKMYDQALELYKIYEDKKAQGAAEEADFLAIKANLKNRERSVLVSVLDRDNAKNELLSLLNHDDLSIDLKTLSLNYDTSSKYELIKSMNLAMQNRRDYDRTKLSAQQNKVDIKLKQAALWPQIDLKASYSSNGINTSSSSEAWEELESKADDSFFIGLNFSLSLNNRKSRADLNDAKMTAKKIIAQMRSIELLVIKEITNSVTTLNSQKNELLLAKEIMDIQAAKLKEEEKRVEYGRSNVDVLVRYQDDARRSEMDYQRTLYKILVTEIDHSLKENTLLNKYLN